MKMMSGPYLEIGYRHGKPFAAYLYLDRQPGDTAARTEEIGEGMLLDVTEDGRPMGIEIVSPRSADLEAMNRALEPFGAGPVSAEDLAPLRSGQAG